MFFTTTAKVKTRLEASYDVQAARKIREALREKLEEIENSLKANMNKKGSDNDI